MTQALFTSMTGLNAGTQQLTVVSDNVANMNTEGYHKQRVNLATRNIAGAIGDNVNNQIRANGGVMIANVMRYNDEYLNNYYRDQLSHLNTLDQQLDAIGDLADIFDDLEGEGLDAALSDFYEALNNLNEYPASSTARTNFIETAKTLVSTMNSKSIELEQLTSKVLGDGESQSALESSQIYVQYSALNEVVIMTKSPAKMLHFEVQVDGEIVEEFRADGLIISTPSGSTAYSMSAGGPILDPKVGGFIIIPICPYKLGVRPFVISDNSEIIVKLLKKGKKAVFVMDGQINEEAEYQEEIKFKKSDRNVYFIRTSKKYFYEKVKEKLIEGGIHNVPRCL